jgi:hypothetical protein
VSWRADLQRVLPCDFEQGKIKIKGRGQQDPWNNIII